MNRTKHIAIAVLSLIFANSSFGTITVNWDMPNLTDLVLRNPLNGGGDLPVNSVWQLIWSPNNSISSFNPSNPFQPSGGEFLLKEVRNANPGYITSQGGSFVENAPPFNLAADAFVGGFVYSRIFDYTGSTSSFNVMDLDGMWYRESVAITGPLADTDANQGPPGSPSSHNPSLGTTVMNQQFFAIPEPSVLGMLFLGLAFVAKFVRRK